MKKDPPYGPKKIGRHPSTKGADESFHALGMKSKVRQKRSPFVNFGPPMRLSCPPIHCGLSAKLILAREQSAVRSGNIVISLVREQSLTPFPSHVAQASLNITNYHF